MKKFLRKAAVFALIFGLIAFAVCYYIDPYNVFHPLSIRENAVEPNKNYIKMKYILSQPDKFDTFIFGSSRVGYLNTQKFTGAKAYNMTYSLAVPQENSDNLKTMLKNGIVPKSIILEVDDISYRMDPLSHREDRMRCPYEYLVSHPLTFAKLYLCPATALESLKTSQYGERNSEIEENFYKYGNTIVYDQIGEYTPNARFPMTEPGNIDGAIESIREIAELCGDNGIDLYVFVSPMHYVTYGAAYERGDYFDFLRRLAEVVPFYNFSGYNDISLDSSNFIDYSHYSAEIGDRIIDRIWNGNADEELLKQGFGFYTDKDNIDELLEILSEGNEKYLYLYEEAE